MLSNTERDNKIEKLIKILICPISGDKLIYDKKKQELISKKANVAFPIIDGIPIMLIEKSRNLK